MASVQPPSSAGAVGPGSVLKWTRHRVRLKRTWNSDWLDADYMECLRFSESAAPKIPTATLRYHAGRIKWEDKATTTDYAVRKFNNWFVRVDLLGEPEEVEAPVDPESGEAGNTQVTPVLRTWTGIIDTNALDLGGAGLGGGASSPATQVLGAFGLEFLLERCPIRGTWILDGSGEPVFIDTIVPCNQRLRLGLSQIGNRSDLTAMLSEDRSTYVFDGKTSAKDWTLANAVDYLLAAISPTSPRFRLAGQLEALESITLPSFDLSGLTVYQALSELISPRLGLGFCVRFQEGTETAETVGDETPAEEPGGVPEIHVYTAANEPITFGDFTLPPNAEQEILDLTDRIDVVSSQVTLDTRASYGRIIVAGEPILVVGTFSVSDQTLERGWTDEDETNYNSVSGATDDQKDAARRAERLRHVFTLYRVPRDWDFTIDGKIANFDLGVEGKVLTHFAAPTRPVWGLVAERAVPYLRPGETADFQQDWREPMVFLKTQGGQWISSDVPGATVTPLDNDLGMRVQFHPPHLVAMNHLSGMSTRTQPLYDYETLAITMAFRTDRRLSVTVDLPVPNLVQADDEEDEDFENRQEELERAWREQVLFIQVPGAELWYALPGTRIDVNKVVDASEAELRNDVQTVRAIAASARAWFGRQRCALAVTTRDLLISPQVGSLVVGIHEAVQSIAINTCLTSKEFDLQAGTVTLATDHAELDFSRPFGRKAKAPPRVMARR